MRLINNQRYAQLAGCNYDDEAIKKGKIVYSRTHTIVGQFRKLAGFGRCKLVTSFSDSCVTQEMADQLPENVIRWYSNNVACDHPRVTAIPIGCVYNVERENVLLAAIDRPKPERSKLMYINFTQHIPRDPNPRANLYSMFTRPWSTVKGGNGFDSVKASEFYNDILQHKYVLSPDGAGPDCHRHWEAMLLGSIPIVLVSKANEFLDDMPCLRVNSWDHVNKDLLERMYDELVARFTLENKRKLYFEYWANLIQRGLVCSD